MQRCASDRGLGHIKWPVDGVLRGKPGGFQRKAHEGQLPARVPGLVHKLYPPRTSLNLRPRERPGNVARNPGPKAMVVERTGTPWFTGPVNLCGASSI
jgi:hypothetical protein